MTSVYIPARAVLGIESEAVQAKDGRPGRRVGIELDMAAALIDVADSIEPVKLAEIEGVPA